MADISQPSQSVYLGGCPNCGRSFPQTHAQECALDKHLRHGAAEGLFHDRRHPSESTPRYQDLPYEVGD